VIEFESFVHSFNLYELKPSILWRSFTQPRLHPKTTL